MTEQEDKENKSEGHKQMCFLSPGGIYEIFPTMPRFKRILQVCTMSKWGTCPFPLPNLSHTTADW